MPAQTRSSATSSPRRCWGFRAAGGAPLQWRDLVLAQTHDAPLVRAPAEHPSPADVDTDGSAPLPRTIIGYVIQKSGIHQLGLAALSAAVFGLSAVPLELQRRIVNDAIKNGATRTILWLAAAYAGVALLEQSLKLALNVYRGWVSEDACARCGGRSTMQDTLPASVPASTSRGDRDPHRHGGAPKPNRSAASSAWRSPSRCCRPASC